ncbi:1-phosphofructokinase family hexose kinase [Agromyces sp. CFH 90414]|uniref:1-phosphofructokinase family hexose kinase n=1 Tax=Agromyces agglutinans TaxID=2662258 RepID=A0A6I2FA21_9MICO|nr:PfkB family carbohydrate kinase [Agromyces agglutinans]MRG61074.1 1-phosphofructokinase family hexose kinase [Agromyces agglutinans]
MIVTVTPNPALDLTWHAPSLVPGTTHRVPAGASRAGGKGLNVARVLHAQGRNVLAVTTAGGATGDEFAADLGRGGIPHVLVPVASATRRSLALVDDGIGEATVVNELGAALAPAERDALVSEAERLGLAAEVVAISGSLPPGLDADDVGGLVGRLTAAGVDVVADVTGPALLAAARSGAAALKPNRDELVEATGLDDPVRAARTLVDLGARLVVASLGGDGLLMVAGDGPALSARLPWRLNGNATGAGDAAVAAICATLAEHRADRAAAGAVAGLDHDLLSALARRATAWSASAVLMPLAGDLHPDHLALEREVILEPR